MWTQWTSENALILTILSGKAKNYILHKTKKRQKKNEKNKLFCKNKVQMEKYNFEIWNPATYGIRNPHTWNPESTALNPESKTPLDYLTWGDHDLRNRSTVTLPTELQGRTEKVGDDFRWCIAAKRKYGYI